jgi:hypothetical protein
MLRAAIAGVILLSAVPADATSCKLDRDRYQDLAGTAGYGVALVCGGEQLRDVWAQFAGDGTLTGISWSEHQGHLRRTVRIDTTGRVSFISQDTHIKGGFFAQARGTSHFLFPRDRTMSVKRTGRLRLVVRDAAGRAWHLQGKPVMDGAIERISYTVIAIDDREQEARPIDHTKAGIVAVDLVAPYSIYLQHEEPQMHGLADRRSKAYLTTKSIFHDGRGNTCAVANSKLFQPRASDPKDKSDNELKFAGDSALVEFLAAECSNLDLKVLKR